MWTCHSAIFPWFISLPTRAMSCYLPNAFMSPDTAILLFDSTLFYHTLPHSCFLRNPPCLLPWLQRRFLASTYAATSSYCRTLAMLPTHAQVASVIIFSAVARIPIHPPEPHHYVPTPISHPFPTRCLETLSRIMKKKIPHTLQPWPLCESLYEGNTISCSTPN